MTTVYTQVADANNTAQASAAHTISIEVWNLIKELLPKGAFPNFVFS